jgi:hypothetical protein
MKAEAHRAVPGNPRQPVGAGGRLLTQGVAGFVEGRGYSRAGDFSFGLELRGSRAEVHLDASHAGQRFERCRHVADTILTRHTADCNNLLFHLQPETARTCGRLLSVMEAGGEYRR